MIATSMPSGNVTSTDLRLFSRAPRTVSVLPLPFRRCFGVAIDRLPERNCPVGDALHASTSSSVPCTTTVPPWTPGPGPHLDDVVGGADRVLVVLDDDDRVADVAQALQRRDHLHVVLRVQADARLVEHVEHPHQPRADLRGQPDPLRLAARERARAAVEVQVVQPDAQEQLQPAADLLQHLPARRRRRGRPA